MQPLPIDPHLPRIAELLRRNRNLVLVADPGAGKTTRVPRHLLEAGIGGERDLVVLEPRRLAVRLAARRAAEEMGQAVGNTVGYQIRFEERAGGNTKIRFVTEGILARQLVTDPTLEGFGVVILDEFHERHLEADLALALLRRLQKSLRPDLHLIVMSATLDPAPVAAFLEAEIIHIEAKRFPVEIEYLDRKDSRPLAGQVASAVRRIAGEQPGGHILVFLPGAGEIRRAQESCAEVSREMGLEVIPLHGDLPGEAQDRAVSPSARSKLILSTNVAESSITIDGVVAVIDGGLAKIARHSPWSGLSSLEVSPISRAAAAQRAGRAGRTAPGRAIRLYTKHDHDTRPIADAPEIRRSDLAATLLTLRASGVDRIDSFEWLEAPRSEALAAASTLLERLGATAAGEGLTATGKEMSRLPLHPRLARLVLAARDQGAGRSGALLAALTSEREVRTAARTHAGDSQPGIDESASSDLLARLEAFEKAEKDGLRPDRISRLGLDPGAVLAASRSRDQIVRLLRLNDEKSLKPDEIEQALLVATLAAFPDRLAKRRSKKSPEIVFANGSARLAETSVVRSADLLVAVEAEEKRGASSLVRLASAVEPEWLAGLFPEEIVDTREIVFSEERQRVESVSRIHFHGLVLEEQSRPAGSGEETSACLTTAALGAGIESFCDMNELRSFRARVELAAEHGSRQLRPDDAKLSGLLRNHCEGRTSFDELRKTSLVETLRSRLSAEQRKELDRLAPERIDVPGRKNIRIDYVSGQPPSLSSRIQDFFGCIDGPLVGGGRVPIVLHLLAPNGRDVQVTADLAGFWKRHYPAIRRELSRRYPRHKWPEDPLAGGAARPKPHR